MKSIQISDELFDELKSLVVDPFDDTPDSVIGRLIQIVKKAKSRWSPLEASVTAETEEPQVQLKTHKRESKQFSEETEPSSPVANARRPSTLHITCMLEPRNRLTA